MFASKQHLEAARPPQAPVGVLHLQGALSAVRTQVRQLFERLPPAPVADAGDARFEHFKKHVWPRIKSGGNGAHVTLAQSWLFLSHANVSEAWWRLPEHGVSRCCRDAAWQPVDLFLLTSICAQFHTPSDLQFHTCCWQAAEPVWSV